MKFIEEVVTKIFAYDCIINTCEKFSKRSNVTLQDRVDYCKEVLEHFRKEGFI